MKTLERNCARPYLPLLVASILMILLSHCPVLGQTDSDSDKVKAGLVDPTGRSPVSWQSGSVSFEADMEAKKVSAKIGVEQQLEDWDFLWEFKVGGPISEGSKTVEPIGLDGLGSSQSGEIGLVAKYWNSKLGDPATALILDAFKNACGAKTASILSMRDTLKAYKDKLELANGAEREKIEKKITTVSDLVSSFNAAVADSDIWPILVYSGHIEVGQKTASYLDTAAANFSEMKFKDEEWAVKASAGFFKPSTGYWGLNLQYDQTFKTGASSEFVIPFGDSTLSTSKELSLGAPTKKEELKIQLEVRKRLEACSMAVLQSIPRLHTSLGKMI